MSKSKKQLRKEATLLANRIRRNLQHANECTQPLSSSLSAFTSIQVNLQRGEGGKDESASSAKSTASKNDTRNLEIEFCKSPLPDNLLNSCLNLFQENMSEMYKKSSWGLDMKEKEEELTHENARYLLVVDSENKDDKGRGLLLAFAHFRFEVDDDDQPTQEVLYLYEIQISQLGQRNGIGKRLMQIMEIMAMQMKMRRVMLTVFKNNTDAMSFYRALKYSIDPSSPSQFGEEADYEILSKCVYRGE